MKNTIKLIDEVDKWGIIEGLKSWYRVYREEVRQWDLQPKVENAPPHPDSTGTHNGVSKFSALG